MTYIIWSKGAIDDSEHNGSIIAKNFFATTFRKIKFKLRVFVMLDSQTLKCDSQNVLRFVSAWKRQEDLHESFAPVPWTGQNRT